MRLAKSVNVRRRAAADSRNPNGCFTVQSALACGDTADALRRELANRRAASEVAIRKRFALAIREGDLPAESNPTDLARYVVTVTYGMAVQAATGADRDDLKRVAEITMRAWPT